MDDDGVNFSQLMAAYLLQQLGLATMEVGEINKETTTQGRSSSSILAHFIGESSAGDNARRSSEPTQSCVNFPHLLCQRLALPEENIASINGRSKPRSSPAGVVRYRDCLKNHAANMGVNIFDGCGEFMPNGEAGTLEALKCAACQCHRNFHRKEVDGELSPSSRRTVLLNHLQLPPPSPSPHRQIFSMSDGLNFRSSPTAPIVAPINVFKSYAEATPFSASKKRFRTKFSQEQKNKMVEFAGKLGWRMQKQTEQEVDKFCAEVGVSRRVLKVWIHNNKTTAIKKANQES